MSDGQEHTDTFLIDNAVLARCIYYGASRALQEHRGLIGTR